MFKKGSKGSCSGCMVCGWVLTLLLLLSTIASAMGAWQTHFGTGNAVFGSTSGSLALIAFVLSATLTAKCMKMCCGCSVEK